MVYNRELFIVVPKFSICFYLLNLSIFFRGFASVYTTLEHHHFCFITLFSFKRDVNAKKSQIYTCN